MAGGKEAHACRLCLHLSLISLSYRGFSWPHKSPRRAPHQEVEEHRRGTGEDSVAVPVAEGRRSNTLERCLERRKQAHCGEGSTAVDQRNAGMDPPAAVNQHVEVRERYVGRASPGRPRPARRSMSGTGGGLRQAAVDEQAEVCEHDVERGLSGCCRRARGGVESGIGEGA